MSNENVEVVRNLLGALSEGLNLDLAEQFWDPDIDWRAIEGAPDDVGVIRGKEALRHYYEQWLETLDDLRAEAEELIETTDGAVAVVRATGRMKGSESELSMRLAIVYTVAGGKVVRGREYATRDEALAAAGLQP